MTPEEAARELQEALANFKLEQVIHPTIRNLPEPQFWDNIKGQKLPITTSSEKAQRHVQQGMAHLSTAWDFEAYRHFAAAAKADPDCLMAYWGISMALGGSSNEFRDEMRHALDRMLVLLQLHADDKDGNKVGSEIERGYAFATGHLAVNGMPATSALYRSISKKFPNDVQSKMWAIFFSRDGYHPSGEPRLGQKQAVEELRKLLLKNLKNNFKENKEQLLTSFWLTTIAEMPNDKNQLDKEALPAARELARDVPDYPIFQHLAGHYEYRCGNAKRAAHYFKNAVLLYENYMKANRIDYHDCPGWVRAKIYLAAALHAKGNHPEAKAIFKELSALPVKKDRLHSAGACLLMWDARSMAARYSLTADTPESFKFGIDCLSAIPADQWFSKESSAGLYRETLIFYLVGRQALLQKKKDDAEKALNDLALRRHKLEALHEQESNLPSYHNWRRAINTLAILSADLKGRVTLLETGATRGTAVIWFKSTVDRETLPSLLMPPNLPVPMEANLAQYYHREKKYAEAAANFSLALRKTPNNLNILQPYHNTLLKMKATERAKGVAQRIQEVKN